MIAGITASASYAAAPVGAISGILAATDGADSFAATNLMTGALSGTDGADSFAGSGEVLVTGTLSGTDGADSASMSGSLAGWIITNGPITFTANSSGWQNFSLRQVIPAAQISVGGSQVRLRLVPATTQNTILTEVWLGHAAASGDAYDFDGTQVQVLFSGAAPVTLTTGGGSITSDPVTYALDETKALVVSFRLSTASATTIRQGSGSSAYGNYYHKNTSATNEAGTTNVTGYTTVTSARAIVDQVEAQV